MKSPGKPKINVNNASKGELMRLPGIGDKLSNKIILYRENNGHFSSINDLQNVKGIGKKVAVKVKPFIVF
jgi:competence protein ComEA